MQVVVLAGGLGTRLRGSIPAGTPKPMARVAGRPFLDWLLDDLVGAGATDIVVLVSHHAEVIREHVGPEHLGVPVRYAVEATPSGTGGAVRDALPFLAECCVVVNGDTVAPTPLAALVTGLDGAELVMGLAAVPDVGRFGGVEVVDGRAVALVEKGGSGPGRINAGVYGMRRSFVESFPPTGPVSFERDVLERRVPTLRPPVVSTNGQFFDIGIPEDLRAADAWFTARARVAASGSPACPPTRPAGSR